jgi:hypothetical protein
MSDDEGKTLEKILGPGMSSWQNSLNLFNTHAKESWEQFTRMLQSANEDLKKKTICTSAKGQTSINYRTDITLEGDIISEFPNPPPKSDDVYWKWHTELTNRVLNERKELLLKAIDSAGFALTKIMNPISFSSVDLVKLAELFKRT